MSPSKSVALPVSANGVRVGTVYCAAVAATGTWLSVSSMIQPLLFDRPAAGGLADVAGEAAHVREGDLVQVDQRERPAERDLEAEVVEDPAAPKGATVAVAPSGRIPGAP